MYQTPFLPFSNDVVNFSTFTETAPGTGYTEHSFSCISLYKCINQVITDLPAGIISEADTIINDITRGMLVSTDKNTLVGIVNYLLDAILLKGQTNIIHISAKLVGSITLIHIRNNNAAYNEVIALAMQKIEKLAETLGGCVTISNNKMHGLTLAFTFINH